MSNHPGEAAPHNHPDDIPLQRFWLRVVYRRAGDDEGLTIHVFGPAAGSRQEVLRFDCFRSQPHYHLGWSYRNEPFTPIEADDPFGWALEKLAERAQDLLIQADAEPMSNAELSELPHVLAAIEARGRALARNA
jgi:hypothetical protein